MTRLIFTMISIFSLTMITHAQNLSQIASPKNCPEKEVSVKSDPLINNFVSNHTETIVEDASSSPLVSIEVLDTKPLLFQNFKIPQTAKTILEKAGEIHRNALYQRQRFDETGQAIEIDRDHLYYRRDLYSYTKGIVFFSFMKGNMDIGIYRKHFSPASTLLSGSIQPDFGQQDANGAIFKNGARVFLGLRMRIPYTK